MVSVNVSNKISISILGLDCEDAGCAAAFEGGGRCVQLGSVSLKYLTERFAIMLCKT